MCLSDVPSSQKVLAFIEFATDALPRERLQADFLPPCKGMALDSEEPCRFSLRVYALWAYVRSFSGHAIRVI